MKTAMQKLIEYLEDGFLENRFNNSDDIIEECEKLLEKEKQQIKRAYNVGGTQAYEISSDEYYNETFS